MDTSNTGFSSKLIHAGGIVDEKGCAITPIYQTSTFKFKDADQGARFFAGEEKGYIYTRLGNPTIEDLENTVAELENGYGGRTAESSTLDDPDLASLHGDPEFEAIVEELRRRNEEAGDAEAAAVESE